MLNIVYGDNILFEATLNDANGTAVTNSVGSLTITDFIGSSVLATNLTHIASGTYQFNSKTIGWGLGPISEKWSFLHSSGTKSQVAFGNYRIMGTVLPSTYIFTEELPTYHENITDYFDGNQEAHVLSAKADVDSRLSALGIKLPIQPRPDGFFDQALRDLNAYEAVIRIVSKRQQSFNRDGDREPWYMSIRKEIDRIYKGIETNKYAFDRDISASEGGISIGSKVSGGTKAQMFTNWQGGVGNGFSDSSYPRDWVIQVTGTGTSGGLEESQYTWSNNGGLSVNGTNTTSESWKELTFGVYVRFYRGTYNGGSTNLFQVNDEWNFKTFPKAQSMAGYRTARSY